ncbi:peptide/nickel transport system permease protein [Geodermatophilus obscurus]|jgi:ABC-type dipeptide/oligopeptide/nickel transport system permease subunit|uniref:Peptide/nickel transport system permease protein n=1 Tax=Geodermatophilus obscurus TaxID=1861 RepID=A0A1M7TEQ9_9ACTN|nr:ABC transporter permease [Geodermatophilus obscurus]SHN69138.1 peptide/nickel transport system permease protein [Geodermatophilus obscurus]
MRAWRRFRSHPPGLIGLGIIVTFVALAALAPVLSPYDPNAQDLASAIQGPSAEHWLGTDQLGRDIATRLMYGARISLLIGVLAVLIGLVVGVPLGIVAGYYGGWADLAISRFADMMFAFTSILLALTLVAVLGVSLQNVIIAVGISVIPVIIRLVRSSVLSLREEPYVEAARALGAGDFRIITRHVFRNSLTPVLVHGTLSIGVSILLAAGLGFLGLGVQSPTAEWGTMLGEGRQFIFSAPHLTTFPGVAIFLAILAFNLLGDGLRDALDPRMRTVDGPAG